MTSRERFRQTIAYGRPDRVPYFEEGIRDGVLSAWRKQGLPRKADITRMFPTDRREDFIPDLEPRPTLGNLALERVKPDVLRRRLDSDDPDRLPHDWPRLVAAWRGRDHVLMLRVHRGLFRSMGINDWEGLIGVLYTLADDPGYVREVMGIYGEFAARLAERVLRDVDVDAAVFSEPIGENTRPLISPGMYEEFVLRSYEPLMEVLDRHGVETRILLTYANARALIPSLLKWRFNCLWACEVNTGAMDYRDLRRRFGPDLRLIGGIDADVLRRDRDAIRREVQEKVPPLLADGGYVPLADGRIREDVPFENYVYYRKLLEEVTRP